MTVAIATPPPVAGRPQPPIYPLIQGNNGGFMAVRSSPAQGACGVSGYPCKHPGVDVNGRRGTKVVSPVNGVVVTVADGNAAPYRGYGPWVVVIRGDDGLYQLLAHLDPATAAMALPGKLVTAGQQVGTTSSANHVHWEVRRRPVPGSGETNLTNNVDPIAWMRRANDSTAALILLGAAAMTYYLIWR